MIRRMCVIMPCYNQVKVTKNSVNSMLKNSNLREIEFIFIDNGSTDETFEFLSTVPNSQIIRNSQNVYVNPAWNQGFERYLNYSVAPYCCLINNDVEVAPDWLYPIFWSFENRNSEAYIPASNGEPEPNFADWRDYESYYNKIIYEDFSYKNFFDRFPGFCLFFKRNWIKHFYPIPECLKIIKGDDWILDNLSYNGIIPTKVSHCVMGHVYNVTQKSGSYHNIRAEDQRNWSSIESQLYGKNKLVDIRKKKPKIKLL